MNLILSRHITSQEKEKQSLYRQLLNEKLDHLNQKDRDLIEPVLLQYAHVFYDEETNDFKRTNVFEHEISTGDPLGLPSTEHRTL